MPCSTIARQQNCRFGKFYRIERVRSILSETSNVSVSRNMVSRQVHANKILRVTTRDGAHLYPAFQFYGGQLEPTISRLVTILASGGMDGWSIAYWLTSPIMDRAVGGLTAVETVYGGGDIEQLLRLATLDAAHWVAATNKENRNALRHEWN